MTSLLKSTWPLFFGIVIIMIGNGLQGTLLGVRATMEGFSTATTGLIMSLYYGGYLTGSILAPRLVKNVGHIRVFAAMASLASAASLLHGVWVTPVIWSAARIVTGFCFAAIYIVIESWMNDISTKEIRGKILGTYLLTFYGAMVLGQYLLNVADPKDIELFILTSVLISIALLPISLSSRPAPDFHAPVPASIKEVYNASPLGVIGVFFSGMGNGIFFTLGPVFALSTGMAISEVANFMAIFILGAVFLQLPLGSLSDRHERRKVIIGTALAAAVATLLCAFTASYNILLYIFIFIYGGTALSIYGLCAAYTNDHIEREKFVSVSARLVLISGIGAFGGPFAAALVMTLFGDIAFFPLLGVIYVSICLYALHRAQIRPPMPIEEQGEHMAMPPRATTIATQIAEDPE